jgi:hypothetical protein
MNNNVEILPPGYMDSLDKKIKEMSMSTINVHITDDDFENARRIKSSVKPADKEAELKSMIEGQLSLYNEKYGTSLKYDSFQEYLSFSALANSEDLAVKELVTNELLTQTANYVIVKSILVSAHLIDKLLVNLQKQMYNEEVTEVTVVTLDKIFAWITRFEEIKEKYKIHDINKAVSRASSTDKGSSSMNTEQAAETNNLLNKLLGR